MTDSDLLDSLVLQRPEPQGFVNVNLNVNEKAEPYGPLISFLSAIASILPYVIAVLHGMMKLG
jgi:hypothetical protein